MSVLKKLTEGMVSRNLQKEGAALVEKWENTGLLEGLEDDTSRSGMARLLENQAASLLKEASAMAAGDVEGFAAVAFPIVRRVFGGLIANDLVSVQPMSLPSGLIFFLDFVHNNTKLNGNADASLYGGKDATGIDVVGRQLTGGVSLVGINKDDPGGFYNNMGAYAGPTGSVTLDLGDGGNAKCVGHSASLPSVQGIYDGLGAPTAGNGNEAQILLDEGLLETQKKLLQYDPDILSLADGLASGSATHTALVFAVSASVFDAAGTDNDAILDRDNLQGISTTITALNGVNNMTSSATAGVRLIRRLTRLDPGVQGTANERIWFTLVYENANGPGQDAVSPLASGKVVEGSTGTDTLAMTFPITDRFEAAQGSIGAVVGDDLWGLEQASNTAASNQDFIAEINIKVDSIAVTAQTKKLKAKWTPELGQDLNAYHNLDAEVELTSILSEQIALEIDRELLQDLIKGATAGTLYWSRRPGKFLNRDTGISVGGTGGVSNESLFGADFTGNVSEWYETLIETINDVSAQIHRKTLRGGANFVVCSPEVANILEFTAGFRANVTADQDKGEIGAVKVGNLSRKFDVYVDPYFPRNVVLVGRKGNSFLESGYVYAPYVPLQVTPTIFGTEDFVPRKGVMTRYAKKMVRPDMYGLVICQDLTG
jgi:hypothetical protein